MKFRNMAAITVVLAATMSMAQGPARPEVLAGNPRAVVATNNAKGLADNARSESAVHKRVEDMGNTLTRMHALLKQMQAKTAASTAKDPMAKANLEMWGLMLADLDKQYEQLRAAARSREDLEARRQAMYKQAEKRSATAAQLARGVPQTPQGTAIPAQDPAPAAESAAPAAENAAQPATTPATAAAPTTSPN